MTHLRPTQPVEYLVSWVRPTTMAKNEQNSLRCDTNLSKGDGTSSSEYPVYHPSFWAHLQGAVEWHSPAIGYSEWKKVGFVLLFEKNRHKPRAFGSIRLKTKCSKKPAFFFRPNLTNGRQSGPLAVNVFQSSPKNQGEQASSKIGTWDLYFFKHPFALVGHLCYISENKPKNKASEKTLEKYRLRLSSSTQVELVFDAYLGITYSARPERSGSLQRVRERERAQVWKVTIRMRDSSFVHFRWLPRK